MQISNIRNGGQVKNPRVLGPTTLLPAWHLMKWWYKGFFQKLYLAPVWQIFSVKNEFFNSKYLEKVWLKNRKKFWIFIKYILLWECEVENEWEKKSFERIIVKQRLSLWRRRHKNYRNNYKGSFDCKTEIWVERKWIGVNWVV